MQPDRSSYGIMNQNGNTYTKRLRSWICNGACVMYYILTVHLGYRIASNNNKIRLSNSFAPVLCQVSMFCSDVPRSLTARFDGMKKVSGYTNGAQDIVFMLHYLISNASRSRSSLQKLCQCNWNVRKNCLCIQLHSEVRMYRQDLWPKHVACMWRIRNVMQVFSFSFCEIHLIGSMLHRYVYSMRTALEK